MNGVWDYNTPDPVRWARELQAGIWTPDLKGIVKREIRKSSSTNRVTESNLAANSQGAFEHQHCGNG